MGPLVRVRRAPLLVPALLLCAVPAAPAAAADLVPVNRYAPSIRSDVKYATRDNFTGAVLPGYCERLALLLRTRAQALARVQWRLKQRGLGLIVYDAYRPLRASRAMVDWARRTGRTWLFTHGYIAFPSNHNRGTTIDLSLVRRRDGHRLDMGTAYDSASRRAWTRNATGRILSRRLKLVRAMAAEGFRNYHQEWWHFDSVRRGPRILDVPLGCGR